MRGKSEASLLSQTTTTAERFTESALTFQCDGRTLIGILTVPVDPTVARRGVVIVVGGPQYRVGSHRQFVRLARRLATGGHCTLRFDHRGMGDSEGRRTSFEEIGPDIRAAVEALCARCPQVSEVTLWALCDAASAALMHASDFRNVNAMVLLNPWVRSSGSLARTHVKHYYPARLLHADFWRKLLRRELDIRTSLRSAISSVRLAMTRSTTTCGAQDGGDFQTKMADGLRRFRGSVLLVMSGNDLTAKEFVEYTQSAPAWRGLLALPSIEQLTLPEADHTFSRAAWRAEVEEATAAWLSRLDTAS